MEQPPSFEHCKSRCRLTRHAGHAPRVFARDLPARHEGDHAAHGVIDEFDDLSWPQVSGEEPVEPRSMGTTPRPHEMSAEPTPPKRRVWDIVTPDDRELAALETQLLDAQLPMGYVFTTSPDEAQVLLKVEHDAAMRFLDAMSVAYERSRELASDLLGELARVKHERDANYRAVTMVLEQLGANLQEWRRAVPTFAPEDR